MFNKKLLVDLFMTHDEIIGVKAKFAEAFNAQYLFNKFHDPNEILINHLTDILATYQISTITLPVVVTTLGRTIFSLPILRNFYNDLLERFSFSIQDLNMIDKEHMNYASENRRISGIKKIFFNIACAVEDSKAVINESYSFEKNLVITDSMPVIYSIQRTSEEAYIVLEANPWLAMIYLFMTQFDKTTFGQTLKDKTL